MKRVSIVDSSKIYRDLEVWEFMSIDHYAGKWGKYFIKQNIDIRIS